MRFPSQSDTDQDSEDFHELTTTARADHEMYCSQLLTKKRGYPLWVPGPGMQLPIEYRRQGISIGDVGIITSTAFDFLFNIFEPADDAINRGLVPQGFSPFPRRELEHDIQKTMDYGPNTYLASSSVRKISLTVRQVKGSRCNAKNLTSFQCQRNGCRSDFREYRKGSRDFDNA
jgi:hypothetical protein